MANLQQTTITDTGNLTVPVGNAAQRPGVVINSGIPTGTNFGQLKPAVNGQLLTISGNGTAWNAWQNLPDYLWGLTATSSINDTDAGQWTFSNSTTVYMIRNPSWNAVDTTGWTTVETNRDYITNETTLTVFSRTFAAGTYSFDNNSAMYLFAIPTLAGTIRYNSQLGFFEGYTGTIWTPLATLNPTDVTIYTSTPGPGVWPVPTGVDYVDVLIVAGGGGGGLCMGGGGGGGGVRYIQNYPVPPGGTIPVSVGGGGAGGTTRGGSASRGGNSNFGPFVATGGGGGANWDGGGQPGGSGGGGAQSGNTPGSGNTPAVNPPQGNPGGVAGGSFLNYAGAGGGGGAGSPGEPGNPFSAGFGGAGVAYAIAGTGPASNYYGGGGGGGIQNGSSRFGIGFDGGAPGSPGGQPGFSALANTGGGGGGQGHPPDNPGGAGGSGIVVIRAKNSTSV